MQGVKESAAKVAFTVTALVSTLAGALTLDTTHERSVFHVVLSADKEIDQAERNIESPYLKLLLQQQPVTRDLRLISSVLKMITDMEHIGDHAQNIAEWVEYALTGQHKGVFLT